MGNSKEKSPIEYALRISENALHNFDEITGYIAFVKHQPLNAVKVGDKLFNTFERIKLNPLAFRECEQIPTKTKIYRKAICMSWLIIFKIKSKQITILGIIHGSRLPSRIKKMKNI